MKANAVTYTGFVQDHSGSMAGKVNLAITNFNEQRASLLKEDDETMDNIVTIIEFDDTIHCNVENMPISEVKQMENWWCGGMTALYDAIAYCINSIKEKMENDPREDKAALVIIQTDGYENYSTDYKGESGRNKINKMINELEETKKWSFVFLGENIDKEIAMDLGFKKDNIMTHDSANTRSAYGMTTNSLGKYMSLRKAGGTQTTCFYDNQNVKDENKPDNNWLKNNWLKNSFISGNLNDISSKEITSDNDNK